MEGCNNLSDIFFVTLMVSGFGSKFFSLMYPQREENPEAKDQEIGLAKLSWVCGKLFFSRRDFLAIPLPLKMCVKSHHLADTKRQD